MTMAMATHTHLGIRPARYRLPEDARIGRVRLAVSDLSRSVAYYTEVLGFRAAREGNVAWLASADGVPLIELHEQTGARPVPRRGRLGLYHFAILLPDRTALGRFVAHLALVGAHAGSADHLADGLLAMVSEPLDLQALVRAAGGEPWNGMPAGTTIGHVHFHVSTLEAAEAFYHSAIGFDKVVWSYPGALYFSAGGYHHHVGTNTWAADAPIGTAQDARLVEWELQLPSAEDIAAVAANAAQAGYPVTMAGADRVIADASGIGVRLSTQRSNS